MESSSVASDAVAFEYLIKALSYSMQIDDAWKALLKLTEAYVDDWMMMHEMLVVVMMSDEMVMTEQNDNT
jgi:hypothetical protein